MKFCCLVLSVGIHARASVYTLTRCGVGVMILSGENLENGNMRVAFVSIVICLVLCMYGQLTITYTTIKLRSKGFS